MTGGRSIRSQRVPSPSPEWISYVVNAALWVCIAWLLTPGSAGGRRVEPPDVSGALTRQTPPTHSRTWRDAWCRVRLLA